MMWSRWMMLFLLFVANSFPLAASGQDDDDEPELNSGLLARYSNQSGQSAERIDSQIAFDWDKSAPDERLAAGPFTARWRGMLMSQARGEYRLFAHASGTVRIELAGQAILNSRSDEPAWHASKPIQIPFDWHPIEIEYLSGGESAQLALFWSGPNFALEPISDRNWFHEPAESNRAEFERGRQLARALRCEACHQAATKAQPGPSLERLTGAVRREWLMDWLTSMPESETQLTASRRMPHFAFTADEANDVANYLLSAEPVDLRVPAAEDANAKPSPKANNKNQPADEPPSGERLFLTLGCLACHPHGQEGSASLFGGNSLTHAGDKRPADYFAKWLAEPASLNAQHRMPVFDLSAAERTALAEWLAKQTRGRVDPSGEPSSADAPPANRDPSVEASIERGRKLTLDSGCQACHQMPTGEKDNVAPSTPRLGKLSTDSRWERACSAADFDAARPAARRQPIYQLADADRAALQHYFTQRLDTTPEPSQSQAGRQLFVELNCVQCHARGADPGLAASLPELVKRHGELESWLPAMTPPSLNSVGDKLRDEALIAAVRREKNHRPYLLARMPRFPLNKTQLAQLVDYFVAEDRIPDTGDLPPNVVVRSNPAAELDDAVTRVAGARLVTPDGFGCTSCHRVGTVEPPPGPLAARGPTLSMLGQRIRRPWYDRWVRNPARIVPRMEMPSVQLPVHGVLNDDLPTQLAAVWQVLNQPGFEPPAPNALRVARRSGVRDRGEPALLLTDVLRVGESRQLKPALVGLPNRHNVLIDLESGRMVDWWIGDAARQRTEGKTWFWEVGGTSIGALQPAEHELSLRVAAGRRWQPIQVGQFVTELDDWQHQPDGGIAFSHRMTFSPEPDSESTATLLVRQTISPIWSDSAGASGSLSGWRREVRVERLPGGFTVMFDAITAKDADSAASPESQAASNSIVDDGRRVVLFVDQRATVRLTEPANAAWRADGDRVFGEFAESDASTGTATNDSESPRLVVEYLTRLPVDQFLLETPSFPPPPVAELNVVPGYEAVRLPLAEELMPTALAWRPNGDIAIASLKGRAWIARDSDGDGLEDTATPVGDELAAPYGIAAGDNYIDVLNKYALLRLHDADGDGRYERTETLASGWGHTTDYHDWAVGLSSDGAGGYFAAFPCQQDKRSEAAARLRGTVVRMSPRTPSLDNPHRFSVKPVSAGHRFPMGLARNRAGDLFVTDNQGNYNPFNELNHVRPGARYGFINALERRPDFRPPLTPPAVNIPHPWTRSVNGICFLETPETIRQRERRDLFGPFEGHLIGCEYDTRRLIRISLQQVGDQIQGAAYPFSYDQPQDGEPLLGPLCCAVAPDGDLYIGNIRDSGWGGANNIGTLTRLRPRADELPPGIAEVRARPDGFEVRFTRPVDAARAADAANYTLSSYTRVSTPAYGGPDVDGRKETLKAIEVADDGRSARLRLKELRSGFVYELHVKPLVDSAEFFPDEAHYSLNVIPQ